MGYKLKKVPATTNNITKAIINFLNSEGHIAVRINVQGQWDEKLFMWRKSGSTSGVLDIACTLAPIGKHLVIDIKRGNDTLSEDQEDYISKVRLCGGIALEIGSYAEFISVYQTQIKPLL